MKRTIGLLMAAMMTISLFGCRNVEANRGRMTNYPYSVTRAARRGVADLERSVDRAVDRANRDTRANGFPGDIVAPNAPYTMNRSAMRNNVTPRTNGASPRLPATNSNAAYPNNYNMTAAVPYRANIPGAGTPFAVTPDSVGLPRAIPNVAPNGSALNVPN